MSCYHFYLEAVFQAMAKNNPTEKQIKAKVINQHWSKRQHENWQKRKCKVYQYKLLKVVTETVEQGVKSVKC